VKGKMVKKREKIYPWEDAVMSFDAPIDKIHQVVESFHARIEIGTNIDRGEFKKFIEVMGSHVFKMDNQHEEMYKKVNDEYKKKFGTKIRVR
jgi:hypothetical protein